MLALWLTCDPQLRWPQLQNMPSGIFGIYGYCPHYCLFSVWRWYRYLPTPSGLRGLVVSGQRLLKMIQRQCFQVIIFEEVSLGMIPGQRACETQLQYLSCFSESSCLLPLSLVPAHYPRHWNPNWLNSHYLDHWTLMFRWSPDLEKFGHHLQALIFCILRNQGFLWNRQQAVPRSESRLELWRSISSIS